MSTKLKSELKNKPHGVHVIGIGRTGAAYVEAMIRTGEIEDALVAEGTSFAALLIDIGEDDMFVPGNYARSFSSRLATRGIPAHRFHYESVLLEMPNAASLSTDLDAARGPYKAASGLDLIAKLPQGFEAPMPGQHTPRAVAKALCAMRTYLGEKPMDGALQRFVEQVKKSEHPSTVLVVFGLAGGTGSGMAPDIARTVKKLLPATAQLAGVGQLSHSGDGDYYNSLAQTMALEEIDGAREGEAAMNPFPAGLFIVATEHSWQRLTAYTSTGVKEVRQRFKQMVTNRFVADSFMRWALASDSEHLSRTLARAAGKWILFDVAKLSHPGVQVLPGEANSRWDGVLQQWIGFTPKYSGLSDKFKTNYAEIHVHAARDMRSELIDDELRKVVTAAYVSGRASVSSFRTEFFDALTAYGNVILSGATKDDLLAYEQNKEALSKLSTSDKALETA